MTKRILNNIGFAGLAALVTCWTGCSTSCCKPDDGAGDSGTKGGSLVESQPQDTVVQAGSTAKFTVSAREERARFQWQFNGKELRDQTKPVLEITDVDYSKLGLYSCLVSAENKSNVTHRAALFLFTVNSQGLLATVQGPLRPYKNPVNGSCPAGHTVAVKGYWSVTNSDTNTRWFPVPAGKSSCTVDTFDPANNPYDTVLTVTEQNNNDPNPSCNDDADPPPGPGLKYWLSQLSFPVSAGNAYNFTIYTKQKPPANPPVILTCNVTWSPP